MTQTRIDLTGTAAREVRLALTAEARAALIEQGLEDPPSDLVFYMEELTERQIETFNREVASVSETDLVVRVMERTAAPGTDPRAIRELVRDMRSTQRAQFLGAYGNAGFVPDAKKTARAVARLEVELRPKITDGLLEQLSSAELSPSSPGTAVSGPGNSTG